MSQEQCIVNNQQCSTISNRNEVGHKLAKSCCCLLALCCPAPCIWSNVPRTSWSHCGSFLIGMLSIQLGIADLSQRTAAGWTDLRSDLLLASLHIPAGICILRVCRNPEKLMHLPARFFSSIKFWTSYLDLQSAAQRTALLPNIIEKTIVSSLIVISVQKRASIDTASCLTDYMIGYLMWQLGMVHFLKSAPSVLWCSWDV